MRVYGPSARKEVTSSFTFGPIRREKLLDRDVVNDGPARRVVLHPGVPERQPHLVIQGLEGPCIRVPPLHAVQCLQVDGLRRRRRDRHVQRLKLRASAGRAERDGVNRPLLHRQLLADLGVIAQPRRVCALRHDEDHPTLLLPRLHELDGAVCLPSGDGCRAIRHNITREATRWGCLEVAVHDQAWRISTKSNEQVTVNLVQRDNSSSFIVHHIQNIDTLIFLCHNPDGFIDQIKIKLEFGWNFIKMKLTIEWKELENSME